MRQRPNVMNPLTGAEVGSMLNRVLVAGIDDTHRETLERLVREWGTLNRACGEAFTALGALTPEHRRTGLVPLARQMADNLARALAECERLAGMVARVEAIATEAEAEAAEYRERAKSCRDMPTRHGGLNGRAVGVEQMAERIRAALAETEEHPNGTD